MLDESPCCEALPLADAEPVLFPLVLLFVVVPRTVMLVPLSTDELENQWLASVSPVPLD